MAVDTENFEYLTKTYIGDWWGPHADLIDAEMIRLVRLGWERIDDHYQSWGDYDMDYGSAYKMSMYVFKRPLKRLVSNEGENTHDVE